MGGWMLSESSEEEEAVSGCLALVGKYSLANKALSVSEAGYHTLAWKPKGQGQHEGGRTGSWLTKVPCSQEHGQTASQHWTS